MNSVREDIIKKMPDAKVIFGSIDQVLAEGAKKRNGDSGAYIGDIEVDLSGSYNELAWRNSGRSKPKKTYQLIIHTNHKDLYNVGSVAAFNSGKLTREQITGVTLAVSNPWEGYWSKIEDVDLDNLPIRADRK